MFRALFCLFVAAPIAAWAQGAPTATIRLRVVDSAGAPVADADVGIVRGTSESIARGTTDAAGRATLTIGRAGEAHQIVVRKIGFQRGYRFFSPSADTTRIEMRLARTVVSLAPVTVTAAEDLKRKSYHLDAEDIENSSRPIIDGTDIFKLRPDMMTSRGGASACAVPYTTRNGWVESVWVNGRRVTLAPVDDMAVLAKGRLGIATPLPPRPRSRPSASPGGAAAHIDTVLSILRSIHPEHIAEITYHDCFDNSVGKNNSDMAMFIALKPGIGFTTGIGSYVVADSAGKNGPLEKNGALDVSDLPRYRFRLLGVYDLITGDPLPNVEVIDSASGGKAMTTATGTVSLFFVPEGTRTLRLRRDGYRDTTMTIAISAADTIPVTSVLAPRSPASPRERYIRSESTEIREPDVGRVDEMNFRTGSATWRTLRSATDELAGRSPSVIFAQMLGGWPRG